LRAPFCDHHVIELSHRLAPAAKLPRLRLKGLLKAAFADVLPREILARRKQGFMIPLARWLRTDLRPLVDDLLSPDRVRARGLFDVATVEGLKRDHLARTQSHADRLWTLMMAELWMRQYLDATGLWSARRRARRVGAGFPAGGGRAPGPRGQPRAGECRTGRGRPS